MQIQVRFFASLRERLKLDTFDMELTQPSSVEQVWNAATHHEPVPTNLLCAVNMEYVALDYEVKAGDEVAFFPPVTGG